MSDKPFSSAEIRQSFLDHFAGYGHTIVPSIPLVPGGDETLLFTNSGMVQFKDVFLGTGTRPYTRVADSQKCMRVAGKHNDLDDVGRDDSHHTFFEMLGNWSFGDYYKKEAIQWAWELLTEKWGLPKEALYATCFEDEEGDIPRDDEAAEIWTQQPGFDPSHVLFFGRDENLWEMAETGPIGPDSEIHMDLGPEQCNMQQVEGHVCRVNGDCTRFLELWNLVFIQYNRTGPTSIEPLPMKHVDTGMGFERIVSVLQGTYSDYKTDLFAPIIAATQALTGHSDAQAAEHWTPYRVIADHTRAAAFLIADGVVPGNLGRNYVTRMIIRRASRFGSQIGLDRPFMAEVAEAVIGHYGETYPELRQNAGSIRNLITDEEQRFAHTVESGVSMLQERLEQLEAQGGNQLPGDSAFDLYATFGLPLEITRDLARERGFETDESGFYQAMEHHREISGGEFGDQELQPSRIAQYQQLLERLRAPDGFEQVHYDPYGGLEVEGPLLAMLVDGEPVETAKKGDAVEVVIPETPFYVEAGGQVSDTGTMVSTSEPRWEIEIREARKPIDGLVVHLGTVRDGQPKVGDTVIASVDQSRRMDIMRNHTATHLLHAALREVLGSHARQAGSLVAPDRLRFDFIHSEPLTVDQIRRIERRVNGHILHNYPLRVRQQPREEAIGEGAMALFGEAYGDTVRTISIAAQPQPSAAHGQPELISYELCGGTHVSETGVIGTFLITSESSAAAGIRRIEAVTGLGALDLIQQRFAALDRIAHRLGAAPDEAPDRVEKLLDERDQLQHELARLEGQLADRAFERLSPEQIDGVPVLTGVIPGASAESLRNLIDRFRRDHPSGVAVLATAVGEHPVIVAAVTQDLVSRGLHAGELVKSVAQLVGGGGGGRPTLAEAGGKDASKLPEALATVTGWVADKLS